MNEKTKRFFLLLIFISFWGFGFSVEIEEDETFAEDFPSEAQQNLVALPDVSLVSIVIPVEFDTFLIGEHTQTIVEKRYIRSFKINKFETSYQLWFEIRTIGEKMGYKFANPGQEGTGGRRGRLPTDEGKNLPVTTISWRDAIVWCNALSEICGFDCAYKFRGEVLRDSTDSAKCDLAECDLTSNGFRLPTEAEWEYAARKQKDGTYQRGDFPSGVLTIKQNLENGGGDVAWFDGNATEAQSVGSTQAPNALGVFDMSGNILEFCWDWFAPYSSVKKGVAAVGPAYGYERVCRGGSWSPYASFILAGDRYGYTSDEAYNYLGFRFVQTIIPTESE